MPKKAITTPKGKAIGPYSLAIEQGAFFEGKSRRSEDPMSVPRAANGMPPPGA